MERLDQSLTGNKEVLCGKTVWKTLINGERKWKNIKKSNERVKKEYH
jgi:hypothetical protein